MKILFIVQGEGRGHMTQAVSLSQTLQEHGHQVAEVLIGKSNRRVIPGFFYKKIQAPVQSYESPNFLLSKNNKGIRLFPSIFYNLFRIRKYLKSFKFINKRIKAHRPDAVVNFYELLGGLYYFLYRPKTPHICIGHQFMIFHPEFEMPPKRYLDKLLLKTNTKLTSLRATKYIALSFTAYPNLPEKSLVVVPPLLRKEIINAMPQNKGYVLAYILNAGYLDEIKAWHQKHKETEVHLFGDNYPDKEEVVIEDNLTWHMINDEMFIRYLSTCSGYATTAGFESVCEAMYLGKPVMMIPTENHFEQKCNALDATKAGAGFESGSFDISKLLDYIPKYQLNNKAYREWVQKSGQMIIKELEQSKK
jgi:uncharacterized protein (TIGR00661 family)